jgi:hypothetical protein
MKNKWLKLAGVAMTVAAFAGSAYALPIGTLTLSDNNGNTTGPLTTGLNGLVSYNGPVGNWSINVSTGIENNNTAAPVLDLNSVDANFFGSGIGDVLTINFTFASVGPLTGGFVNLVNGNQFGITTAFSVLINGSPVSTQAFGSSYVGFGSSTSGSAIEGTSVGILATLTATSGGLASFDDHLSVPDGGMTVMLLGAALSAMGLLRKKLVA